MSRHHKSALRSSTLYSRIFLLLLSVMLASSTGVRSFFSSVARFSKVEGKQLSSFKEEIVSRKVEANVNTLEKNFKKDLKLGVLFLNLGGPETLKDVRGFLYNLFADPDIIRLPCSFLRLFQGPIAYFIAKNRAPKSSIAYASIGGGSPIVKYTREQSNLVAAALRERGFEKVKSYFAMRYWHPYTEEVLKEIQKDKIDTLVVVPLYPHYSVSTSGSSLKLLNEIFNKQPSLWGQDKLPHTVVSSWFQRPGYVNTMARLVIDQLVKFNESEMKQGVHVLFSAHGVPESYIEGGDPYQKHITECVALVSHEVSRQLASDKLRPREISASLCKQLSQQMTAPSGEHDGKVKGVTFHLSFQSRVGPVQWLRPYTDFMIKKMAEEEKVRNLIVVPVSFVSEHIETLEEIDMEYKELAIEAGVTHWERVPALNTDQAFMEDIADLVVDALEAPTLSVSEAASKAHTDDLLQKTIPGLDTSIVHSMDSQGERIRL